MNIEARLRNAYCKDTILAIADEVGDNAGLFEEIMAIFLGGDALLEQRVAWVISTCLENYPALANPHIYSMADMLEKDVHNAVKRCVIRSLSYVELPEDLHGKILHNCFNLLEDRHAAIALRVFSMSVIDRLSNTYPDIRIELVNYLKDEIDYGSAGFKSRARKILKRHLI